MLVVNVSYHMFDYSVSYEYCDVFSAVQADVVAL